MLERRHLCIAALALVAAGGESLHAQDSIPARKPFVFGITANAMSIDPSTAGTQLVNDRSWGMQIDAGLVVAHYLYIGVDLGPQKLSDRASFTQNTTGGNLGSSATLVYYSALVGPRTPSFQLAPGLPQIGLGVYGGVSGTSAERGIDTCVDCYADKLEIPGGTFVQPTLLFGSGPARVRVSDRLFLGGTGIRSVISAGMELGGR
jgi:hypothetical protein